MNARFANALDGLVVFGVAASFCGEWIPSLDLLSHFRVHAAVLLLVLMIRATLGGRRRALLAIGGACLVNAIPLTGMMLAEPPRVAPTARSFTVVLFNAQVENPRKPEVARWLAERRPDLVVIQEATDDLCDRILETGGFERVVADLRPGEDAKRSSALFCRCDGDLRVEGSSILRPDRSRFALTILEARIRAGDVAFDLFVPRFPPPIPGVRSAVRRVLFETLKERTADLARPALIVADFNTTPFSAEFHRLLSTSDLRDLGEGFGYAASWPSLGRFSWLGIPIDRIVGTRSFLARRFEVVADGLGSDHHPVFAEIAIGE